MANEYTGFYGNAVRTGFTNGDPVQLETGFKGSSVVISKNQYIENSFGFKGFSVRVAYAGRVTKSPSYH